MLTPLGGARLPFDLYHVDTAYISWLAGKNPTVTFDLYARKYPFGGRFLLVAGTSLAAGIARQLAITADEVGYLRSLDRYPAEFLDHLTSLRFSGSIWAMPEGEVAFANEPIMRVTGPFREAILLESLLLHIVGVSTLIATKAARIVHAAAGRPVAEFGFRRAQSPTLAARSAYIGGCASTSFLSAAMLYDNPASGTIPHALVELFDTEGEAFMAVAEALRDYALVLDTYDVRQGIDVAIETAFRSQRLGHRLTAVRLDSGDLAADAVVVRQRLDAAGLGEVRIVASGDLDEWRIAELVATGAPIDGFGAGTSLSTGAGSVAHAAPGGALAGVYKLVWIDDGPMPVKIAGEKSTWPGIKQVVRRPAFGGDLVQLAEEPHGEGDRPLLVPMVDAGMALDQSEPLAEAQARAARCLAELPASYRRLDAPEEYPVAFSPALLELQERAMAAHHRPAHRA